MKKIAALLLLLLPCALRADTLTTRVGATKPTVGGSINTWGPKLNSDFDIFDSSGVFQAIPNTLSSTNSFSAAPWLTYLEYGDVPYLTSNRAITGNINYLFFDPALHYLGVGTSIPSSTVTVAGPIESTAGGFIFPDGSQQTTAGSIIIGAPVSSGAANRILFEGSTNLLAESANLTFNGSGMFLNGSFELDGGGSIVMTGSTNSLINSSGGNIAISSDLGTVSVATTTHGSTLTVNGRIESLVGGYKFPDGTTQTSASSGMSIGGTVTSATTGSIPYIAAGPVLAQDNSNLFWDASAKALGIATGAPLAPLDVKGATAPQAILRSASTAIGLDMQVGGVSIGGITTSVSGAASNFTLRSSTGSLRLLNGTADSGIYIPNSGFVGVNNTAPASTFTVTGSLQIVNGWLKFADNTIQTTAASGTGSGGDPQVSFSTGIVAGSLLPLTNGGTNATSLGGAFISTGTGVANRLPIYGSTSAFVTDSALTYLSGTLSATTFSGSGASLTSLPAANLTGTVAVANGGTGATTLGGAFISTGTPAANGIMVGVSTAGYGTTASFKYLGISGTQPTLEISTASTSVGDNDPAVSIIQNSSGDAYMRFGVGTAQSWAVGIDNSDSDALEFNTAASSSANISQTNPPLRIQTGGIVSVGSQLLAGNTSGLSGPSPAMTAMVSNGQEGIITSQWSATDANPAGVAFYKSGNGTIGTLGDVVVGEGIGRMTFYGYKNSVALNTLQMDVVVSTFNQNRPISSLAIKVATGSASAFNTVVYVSSDNKVGIGLNNTQPTRDLDLIGTASFTGGIVGSAAADNATAGNYGEFTSTTSTGFTNIAATGQFGNVVSASYTAGDWDLHGCVTISLNSSVMTDYEVSISSFSANTTTDHTEGYNWLESAAFPIASANATLCVPEYRVSLSAATTMYLKVKSAFTVATPQALGTLVGRRAR